MMKNNSEELVQLKESINTSEHLVEDAERASSRCVDMCRKLAIYSGVMALAGMLLLSFTGNTAAVAFVVTFAVVMLFYRLRGVKRNASKGAQTTAVHS